MILIALIFSGVLLLAAAVCCLCDFLLTGGLSWSLVVLISIALGWAVIFPTLLRRRKGLWISLAALTLLILPYLWALSLLLAPQPGALLFTIGVRAALPGIVYLWAMWLVLTHSRKHPVAGWGIVLLLLAVLDVALDLVLADLMPGPAIDQLDLLITAFLLLAGLALIVVDIARSVKNKNGAATLNRKKNANALFGGGVEPNCAYCANNRGAEGESPRCALGKSCAADACREYRYDPLQRVPRTGPKLHKERFSPEDFKL